MPAGERPIVAASQGPEPEPELSSTRGLRRTDMMLLVRLRRKHDRQTKARDSWSRGNKLGRKRDLY